MKTGAYLGKRGRFGRWIGTFGACLLAFGAASQDLKPDQVREYLGSWQLKGDFQGNPMTVNLDIFDSRGKVLGVLSMPFQRDALAVEELTLTDDGLLLNYEISLGPQSAVIDMLVKPDGDTLSGNLGDENGFFKLEFAGERGEFTFPRPLASKVSTSGMDNFLGTWRLMADMQGQKVPLTLHLADAGGKFGAILDSAFAPQPQIVQEVSKAGNGLHMAFSAKMGPQQFDVTVQVELQDDGVVGSFGEANGLFTAEFTGARTELPENLIPRARFASAQTSADEAAARQAQRGGPREIRFRMGGQTLRARYGGESQESPDYARIAELADGDVISFRNSRCIKILSDFDMVFGDVRVPAQNAAPDYPGVYGMWVKRRSDGWALVFNSQADVWGTQYDPSKDAHEVPLRYKSVAEAEPFLNLSFTEAGGGGALRIAWGTHEWTADFTTQ